MAMRELRLQANPFRHETCDMLVIMLINDGLCRKQAAHALRLGAMRVRNRDEGNRLAVPKAVCWQNRKSQGPLPMVLHLLRRACDVTTPLWTTTEFVTSIRPFSAKRRRSCLTRCMLHMHVMRAPVSRWTSTGNMWLALCLVPQRWMGTSMSAGIGPLT